MKRVAIIAAFLGMHGVLGNASLAAPGIWPALSMETGDRGAKWSRTEVEGCSLTNSGGDTFEDYSAEWRVDFHIGGLDWENPTEHGNFLLPRQGATAPELYVRWTDMSERFRAAAIDKGGYDCSETACEFSPNYADQPMNATLATLLAALVGGPEKFKDLTAECAAALDNQGAADGN